MKAIKDVCNLSRSSSHIHEIAVGIEHLYNHISRLFFEANEFPETAIRSQKIIEIIASEECAKILILIDALRINKNEQQHLSRQLGYFNEHLAKGIYVQYYWTKPSSFKNVREFVELERPAFYRDGPNGSDWIFRNDLLRRREEKMYVDYIRTEDGHTWWGPDLVSPIDPQLPSLPPIEPEIWRLVQAFKAVGMLQETALIEMQQYWQQVTVTDTMSWQKLCTHNECAITILKEKGLLRDHCSIDMIINQWLFPLYPLELGQIKNRPEDLPMPTDF